MQNAVVKYATVFLLMFVFINRGLFVAADEPQNQGGGAEINSVIEWIHQLATGTGNDIDEDGDMQTDFSFTHFFICDFPNQFALINIFPKEISTNRFPNKENFLFNDFRSQLDQPPEII